MLPLRLADDTILIPADLSDPADGVGLVELGPDYPDYWT
jgi:hypothetical protein